MSVKVVVFAASPAVNAEIVTVKEPTGVLADVVTAVLTFADGFAGLRLIATDGEKLQLAPAGRPLQLKLTVPLNGPSDPKVY